MSTSDIFLGIKRIAVEIGAKRFSYVQSIEKKDFFEDSKKLYVEIKNLEGKKAEMESQLFRMLYPTT